MVEFKFSISPTEPLPPKKFFHKKFRFLMPLHPNRVVFGLEDLGIKILQETVKNCALFERQPG
jgi:hypothetical protein